MYKAVAAKYRAIYNNKVLPKKSVTENTQAIFDNSLEILEDFQHYITKANDEILVPFMEEEYNGTKQTDNLFQQC